MTDSRHHCAWQAEQRRLRRERRAYWLSIGEVYLTLCLGAHAALALAVLVNR